MRIFINDYVPRTLPRPLLFTAYMRASAVPMMAWTAFSGGQVARPTLALAVSSSPLLMRKRGVDEFLVEIGGRNQGFACGGFGHHHDEFVAAVTEAHIFWAGQFFEACADAAKEFAADEVAVNVVHGFESVEIDESEADRLP